MKHFVQLILLLFTMFYSFGQTQSLSGHWRRLDFAKWNEAGNEKIQYGDLLIREDSTFTIVGDKTAGKPDTPGWNSGDTLTGKWKVNDNLLYFYIDDLRIPLVYRIKQRSKRKLHLQSTSGGSYVQKYRRLD